MKSWLEILRCCPGKIRDFLDEKAVKSAHSAPLSGLHRFAHFWLMVWRSFSQNRCPMRASALAYISLLALIPMLFVVFSVTNSIVKDDGTERVSNFIYNVLASMTPPTKAVKTSGLPITNTFSLETTFATVESAVSANTNSALETGFDATIPKNISSRDEMKQKIQGFVQNVQSGKLGVLGVLVLVAVAISMLSSIETTFNDIWSVSRGRGWVARVIQYWAVISLGPIILAVVLALISSAHVKAAELLLTHRPVVGWALYHFLPVVLLCFAFALFYFLMPNTKVHWDAALVGGLMSGTLWHLNNYFSVLYVSRWVTNSNIYGNLAIIPVFMAGLYLSWLIVLFGAQVAHAFQNRAAYLQDKRAENINQRGREFVALRLMELIGQRFQYGEAAATLPEIADRLAVPTRLIQQITQTLLASQLVVEITGGEPAYAPSRPLDKINCHDILLAMRAGQGEELATRDEPARAEVVGEFERILAAEKQAASSVTILGMITRGEQKPASITGPAMKAVTDAVPNQK
jgi:membrane protein